MKIFHQLFSGIIEITINEIAENEIAVIHIGYGHCIFKDPTLLFRGEKFFFNQNFHKS